ncbi:MAG: NAD-dependent epimerase/dehydratase family protein [Cocleimonas sp.]|nr:NAD-dependent epimerase/dehydratase family protein [Cocleimonas sp.]
MILVTGATGFVGMALIRHLNKATNHSITAVTRKIIPDLPTTIFQVCINNLDAKIVWTDTLKDIDVIIHTAARVHIMNEKEHNPLHAFRETNVEGTLNLAKQAAKAGVKRFIYLSSIKVNGEFTQPQHPFTANDLPHPVGAYAQSKYEAEQALQALAKQTNIEIVIIRPPLVYGEGVKGNFLTMMKWLNKGIPLPFARIHNTRSLVALENIIDLIEQCLYHPAAVNEVFLVSDDHDLSTSQLLKQLQQHLKKANSLYFFPTSLLTLLATLIRKTTVSQRLFSSLQIDMEKTKTHLNWVPPVSMEKALQKTAVFYQENLPKK